MIENKNGENGNEPKKLVEGEVNGTIKWNRIGWSKNMRIAERLNRTKLNGRRRNWQNCWDTNRTRKKMLNDRKTEVEKKGNKNSGEKRWWRTRRNGNNWDKKRWSEENIIFKCCKERWKECSEEKQDRKEKELTTSFDGDCCGKEMHKRMNSCGSKHNKSVKVKKRMRRNERMINFY